MIEVFKEMQVGIKQKNLKAHRKSNCHLGLKMKI